MGYKITKVFFISVFAVMLLLAVLELRLRTASNLELGRGRSVSADRNKIRVLAIGDSITMGIPGYGNYPALLEDKLNAMKSCVQFEVVNLGMPGAETYDVLQQIDRFIEKYRPDAIVSMIGGYDQSSWDETSWQFKARSMLRNLRIVRLFSAMIRKHVPEASPSEERETPSHALDMQSIFSKFYESGEDNSSYTHQFGNHLRREKLYDQAIYFHKKILEKYPNHNAAMVELGYVYKEQGAFQKAEEVFKRAIALAQSTPTNGDDYTWAYFGLGELYAAWPGKKSQAEAIYLEAQKRLPKWHFTYIFLSSFYKKNNDRKNQEKILLEGVQNCPDDIRIRSNLSELYREMGNMEESRKYRAHAEKLLELEITRGRTLRLYSRLSSAIVGQHVLHVAMSYPLRSADSLRKALSGDKVVFVDNQEVFRKRLASSSYGDLFIDDFGGDFGHLTAAGAEMLAENVARTLAPYYTKRCNF